MKEKAVVLVSGGMDSCVTAVIASQSFDLAFFHVNYGQRTEQREHQAFQALADYFGIKDRLVVNGNFLARIGGSSLTDKSITVEKADLEREGIPSSYVPFRNAIMLSIATSWAEVLGATHLFIGAVEEDSSGYPDCRKEFYDAFDEVVRIGTKPTTSIKIETPIIGLKKAEIVKKGKELNAPFHLTWSCYQSEDRACGVCDSCALRLRGFQEAGFEDPILYVTKPIYLK